MNKNARSKNQLKLKAPLKWIFIDIIPTTPPKSLTSETNFSNFLLIVDAYPQTPKLYGTEKLLLRK